MTGPMHSTTGPMHLPWTGGPVWEVANQKLERK